MAELQLFVLCSFYPTSHPPRQATWPNPTTQPPKPPGKTCKTKHHHILTHLVGTITSSLTATFIDRPWDSWPYPWAATIGWSLIRLGRQAREMGSFNGWESLGGCQCVFINWFWSMVVQMFLTHVFHVHLQLKGLKMSAFIWLSFFWMGWNHPQSKSNLILLEVTPKGPWRRQNRLGWLCWGSNS